MKKKFITFWALVLFFLLPACQPASAPVPDGQPLQVLAVESFLTDISQNVAGERITVASLIPLGVDPHAFEPTPREVAQIAQSQVLIVNGAGFEEWLETTLANAGGERMVIEASAGLTPREMEEGTHADEPAHEGEEAHEDEHTNEDEHGHETDPHFWFDPLLVIKYVENIRDGLVSADPEGKEIYTQNAAAYIAQLNELHTWIEQQVAQVPVERRILVTNHESFGYFADRYGFTVLGAVIPSVSTAAAPSAQQLARLVDDIRAAGAPAIFLETGANPELAAQLARETGTQVVTGLYTHSLSTLGGEAPTYIDLMKFNVNAIVETLK